MMKGRWYEVLNPLGRLSPLNPRHRWNPLRSVLVERRPPGPVAGKGHESLLAKFYGEPLSLDKVPAPNMEWWWQTIDLELDTGQKLSIITNVQLFAVPIVGLIAQATAVVREVSGAPFGRVWEAHASGAFNSGPNARFNASGFRLGFAGGKYLVDIATRDFELHVESELGALALLGDRNGEPGWYDLNPDGLVPIWASYQSAFGSAQVSSAKFSGVTLKQMPSTVGRVRFDHQSLHFSPRDVGMFSLPVLAEGLLVRPRWLWYHARLTNQSTGRSINLMLCKVTNGHTEKLMKLAAALSGDDGKNILIDSSTIELSLVDESAPSRVSASRTGQSGTTVPDLRGRVPAPGKLFARFEVPASTSSDPARSSIDDWEGAYELTFTARSDDDWTVHYPIVGPLRYEAQEVPIVVTGTRRPPGARSPVARSRRKDASYARAGADEKLEGEGTQEVLDMLSSVTFKG